MIKGVLENLEKNRSKQIVVFILSMMILTVVYLPLMQVLGARNEKKAIQNRIAVKDRNILTGIEDIVHKNDKFIVNGWCISLGSHCTNICVLFQDTDSLECEIVSTQIVSRKDVSSYYTNEYEYADCGFSTEIEKKRLKKDSVYEIYLHFTNEDKLNRENTEPRKVSTGKYVLNGKVYSYNPKDFVEPQIANELIQKAICEGELLLYDNEKQLWIYMFESKLYYIANTDIEITEETNIGVPVMVHTSLPNKLPPERVQYGFDHLGFYFADNTYQREDVKPYQIFVVNCDVDYPITYVTTGLYDATNAMWVDGYYEIYIGDSFFED